MNAMNQIIIEGNVVRDSSVKETVKGTKVATMPIASNRLYLNQKGEFQSEVGYFDIQCWGEGFCERVAKNGIKGRGVRVIGRLKQDRWKNESGKTVSKIYILAEHIDFKPPVNKDQPETDTKPVNPALTDAAKTELNNLASAAAGLTKEIEEEYSQITESEAVF